MEAADTMIIFSTILTESVNQGKAQFHPILIFWCDVNGTLFYFANDTFHFFLFILRGKIGSRKQFGQFWNSIFKRDILPILGGKYFL